MSRPFVRSVRAVRAFLLAPILIAAVLSGPARAAQDSLKVEVTPKRPKAGETVKVEVRIPPGLPLAAADLKAALLVPRRGAVSLALSPAKSDPRRAEAAVPMAPGSAEGLYAVHAWSGDPKDPAAIGKAAFLYGKIIADYPILSAVDPSAPGRDIQTYLEDFRGLGGSALVLHVLIDSKKAFYPSKICRTDVKPGSASDIVEGFLARADAMGFPCLLSVSWDMTRPSPQSEFPAQIAALAGEQWALYRHHPSLAGFYSYQEGSGTYFVPYLAEFCRTVKALDPGLLTACAPYVDDPLLAGYLGALDGLDMIIYQGMVMASYRPDNVKKYPLRRVRDFCGVGVGGKWLQDKIAITHMELFGYGENRTSDKHNTTSPANVRAQILAAAATAGSDGFSFFTYQFNVHQFMAGYPEIRAVRQAVREGLEAFNVIWENVSRKPSRAAVYYPYSDWVIERWATGYLPALDAFRALGVPVDFLPFEPHEDESLYPFYPYKPNGRVLARLLAEGTVLVLPDVSGFHTTDSEFIKAFLDGGGAIIAFGPHIPFGNTYDRNDLFGGAEAASGWRLVKADPLARLDDGTASAWVHRRGKGTVIGFAFDAATAVRRIPGVVRQAFDIALSRGGRAPLPAYVEGLSENTNIAWSEEVNGFRIALVNHNSSPLDLVIMPRAKKRANASVWRDLATSKILPAGPDGVLKISLPAAGYLCLEFASVSPPSGTEAARSFGIESCVTLMGAAGRR